MLKQNPFSLYDFLGYFTPGVIFLYGCMAAIGHSNLDESLIKYVKQYQSLDKPEFYIPFILTAYVSGHFMSFLSSITVENYSNWAFGYPSKYLLGEKHDGYFSVSKDKLLHITIRILVGVIFTPVVLFDLIFGQIVGARVLYVKSLDDLLTNTLRKKINKLFIEHAEVENIKNLINDDFFRYVYHYTVENAPNHLPKMQNYVALFGFLRTITLISVIFFWISVLHVAYGSFSCLLSVILLVLSAITTFIFFLGFVKFYRRFSLEALMAFAVTYGKQEHKHEAE